MSPGQPCQAQIDGVHQEETREESLDKHLSSCCFSREWFIKSSDSQVGGELLVTGTKAVREDLQALGRKMFNLVYQHFLGNILYEIIFFFIYSSSQKNYYINVYYFKMYVIQKYLKI